MSTLSNQQQNQSFEGLLQIPGGVTAQLQQVQDGNGNNTGLWLSSTNTNVLPYDAEEQVIIATAGQTVFNLSITYTPATNSLQVFIDGLNQVVNQSYTETDSNTVTFVTGLNVGAVVKFSTAAMVSTNAVAASSVSFTGANGVHGNVQDLADPTGAAFVGFTGANGTEGNVQDLADPTGSDFVGFKQAGTGAVLRTSQDKMREFVSVLDFGADPTGATNSLPAIQAAINNGKSIYFPDGTFRIDSSIIVNVSDVIILGAGRDQSIIQASGSFPVFTFANNSSITNISNFVLKNIALQDGTYGLYASRNTGSFLTLERFFIDDVSIASQSIAGLYLTGSQLGFFVNVISNTAFRYCGRGFVLDNVFSANLNHIDLCRFEGNDGNGIKVTTTNQECSLFTIEKCRFEAITTEAAINITSGTQALSVKENYFEDCPAGVMEFDSDAGLNVSTLIESNNVSSNSIPVNVITFSSQCINTSIVNNTFRQGAGPATITGSAFCTGFNVYGNGAINFTGFTASFNAFSYYDEIDGFRRYTAVQNHTGTFTYDFTLPQEGMYNVQVSLLDDGDVSLGGVAYFLITWITGGAPILDGYTIRKVLNPNTTDIAATVNSAGMVTITFTKATAVARTAYIYASYSNLVVTP